MNKVFFDASVIIAALISPTGGSAKLIEFSRNKAIIAITSQTVIDEVADHAEKIHTTLGDISWYIKESGMLVRERVTQTEIEKVSETIDSSDAHLVVGARSAACHYLVTLDKKHLLRADVQKMVTPLRIVNPKELLGKLVLVVGKQLPSREKQRVSDVRHISKKHDEPVHPHGNPAGFGHADF